MSRSHGATDDEALRFSVGVVAGYIGPTCCTVRINSSAARDEELGGRLLEPARVTKALSPGSKIHSFCGSSAR